MNFSNYFAIVILFLVSCAGNQENPRDLVISDLPFHRAKNAKEYSDLILKAIRTSRDIPIVQEFQLNHVDVDQDRLNEIVGMYSSAIGGRDDWKFYDIYALSTKKSDSVGFDYAWLDPHGRLGIQINIKPHDDKGSFSLEKIEFRSRLEIMESVSFPGGPIDDYKKIDYGWTNE